MDNKFKYLIGYSLKKRIWKKSYLVVNIILLILVMAISNLGNIIQAFGGDFNDTVNIYLYDETNLGASKVFIQYDEAFENTLSIFEKENFNIDEKDSLLEEADCIIILKINENNYVYADCYLDELSLSNEQAISNITSNVKTHFWLLENNSIQEELDRFNSSQTIIFNRTSEDDSSTENAIVAAISMIIIFPTFFLLILLIQFLGIDIIEEKSSRSIEVIISNVPAGTHFASKLVSILLFMVIQVALLFLYTIIGAISSLIIGGMPTTGNISSDLGSVIGIDSQIVENIISRLPGTIITVILFIFVGYLMYLIAIAVLSSMANTMDDFQSFQTPIMITLLIGFYAAIFGLEFDGAIFMKILGYIPVFSPILAPVLFFSGTFSLIEIIISFVILVLFTLIIIYFGIPLYKASILDYSEGGLIKKFKKIIKKSKYVE